MRRYKLLVLLVFLGAGSFLQAQDSTKLKGFDYTKLKPIVHFFGNAEFNPSADVSKDYSFWIGRTLFGFQYQYDKHWSGKVLIDRTKLTGSINTMYVKTANLRWTPNDRFAMEGGVVSQNNYVPFETYWGYRFVAETFQDRYFAIPSTDIGLIAYYQISKKLALDVAVTNGEGPRIDQDSLGRIKLAGGINFYPVRQIQARAFYHLKSMGTPGHPQVEQLFNAFLIYRPGNKIRFGAEFIYVKNYSGVEGTDTYGGTLFGCITLYKTLNYVLRYDRLIINHNQGTIVAPSFFSQNALISGVSVSPVRGITLCVNYQGSYRINSIGSAGHRVLFTFEYKI
jgi:hypothetical protein